MKMLMVHGGFVEAYLSVRDQLIAVHEALQAEFNPSAVLVTGHSLGAIRHHRTRHCLAHSFAPSAVHTIPEPAVV